MLILIPQWFFSIQPIIYILASMIGFLVSFYFYRSYTFAKQKEHYYMYLSFASLSMGFLVFGITELYTYLSLIKGLTTMFTEFSSFRDFGIWIYYACSLISYSLLCLIYLPKNLKFALFLPYWYKGFPYFHVLSLFLISYVIFRSTANWFVNRTRNSMLVMLSFLMLGLYHMFMFFTSFSEWMVVIAHVALICGFLSMFWMIFRVSRKKGRF
ncbi:MAG: hypothetical protein PHU12_03390 [Candidatus Aenigmarchaeota archaeon]|nr:hypothetical protein [Candidatus Aenigmarchaeota archaeon]